MRRGIQGLSGIKDGTGGAGRKDATLTTHPSTLFTLQSETIILSPGPGPTGQ